MAELSQGRPIGYLVNYPGGVSGERGWCFNYLLASNGLFIEAESPLITARLPVVECEVRGLAPLENKLVLTYGSIPQRFWDLALDAFLADPGRERYVAVTVKDGYHFYVPVQDQNGGSVTYEVGDNVVLELHSHGHMGAFFSYQDDRDEQGFKIYCVVGKLNTLIPVVRLRLGIYGYFMELSWKDVFDGALTGVKYAEEEVWQEPEERKQKL